MLTYTHNGHTATLSYRVMTNHIHYLKTAPKETSFSLVCVVKVGFGHSRLNISFNPDDNWEKIRTNYERNIYLGLFDRAEMVLHAEILPRIKDFIEEKIDSLTAK